MPWQPADEPLQLEDAEGGHDLGGDQAGADDQLVDASGAVVELAQEHALLVGEGELGGMADGSFVRGGADLAEQRAELLKDVVDRLHQWAPSRIRRWQPRLARLSTGPGTAKTSRFCSIAWWAVESEPLRGAASTTTTPSEIPEMMRFL